MTSHFFCKKVEGMVFVMSIKKCLLVLFMMAMSVIMIVGCMSDNALSGEGDSDESTPMMEVVAEESAEIFVSASEEFTENSTIQVSAKKIVVKETNVEAGTEAFIEQTEAPTKISLDSLTESPAPVETTETAEDVQPTTEKSESIEAEPATATSKPVETEIPEPQESATSKPIIYDPHQVVNLVITKCQAGGMITTKDNLANLLAEGKITQAEYDEYYPLDGLEGSYYSVFVETDLNMASDIVGNKLGSVDGIADYIAGMLLLETQPIFNVSYAGIYTHNGVDFYEFRCHR